MHPFSSNHAYVCTSSVCRSLQVSSAVCRLHGPSRSLFLLCFSRAAFLEIVILVAVILFQDIDWSVLLALSFCWQVCCYSYRCVFFVGNSECLLQPLVFESSLRSVIILKARLLTSLSAVLIPQHHWLQLWKSCLGSHIVFCHSQLGSEHLLRWLSVLIYLEVFFWNNIFIYSLKFPYTYKAYIGHIYPLEHSNTSELPQHISLIGSSLKCVCVCVHPSTGALSHLPIATPSKSIDSRPPPQSSRAHSSSTSCGGFVCPCPIHTGLIW